MMNDKKREKPIIDVGEVASAYRVDALRETGREIEYTK